MKILKQKGTKITATAIFTAQQALTDWSVNQFVRDWESVYGIGQTTLDVK